MSLIFVMMSLLPAFAEDLPDAPVEPQVIYRKVTTLDMGEIGVEAGIARPTGTLVTERPRLRFHPLFRLRADFTDEIQASVSDVN